MLYLSYIQSYTFPTPLSYCLYICDRLGINRILLKISFFYTDSKLIFTEHDSGYVFVIGLSIAKLHLRERTPIANIDYEKHVIESFPYNTSVYYVM